MGVTHSTTRPRLDDRWEPTGTKVLIFGLGLLGGGVGVARYFAQHGAALRITDLRSAEELRPTLEALSDIDAEYVLGEHREEDFAWADVVLRNPGVPPSSRWLRYADELGKRVDMELSYVVDRCPAHITAVTGTKGKTTTTTLLHQLLESGGEHVELAGNMGKSAITLLDELTIEDHLLLEISAQQLEGRLERGWGPRVAVITNVDDDHLERYGSLEAYREVKASLARGQHAGDWAVLPAWDAELAALCVDTPASTVFVRDPDRPFVVDATDHAAVVDVEPDRLVWIDRRTGEVTELASLADFGLLGRHNRVNLAFAVAAAYANGRTPEQISGAISTLQPPEHRLQPIGTGSLPGGHQVTFVDDTTATAPIAVASALEALSAEQVVLICGGVAKGSDFAPMVTAIEKSGAQVVTLPGTGTDRIVEQLTQRDPAASVTPAADMDEAVRRAVELATASGATRVLLSPGCASFGLFRNEFHRGQAFADAVRLYVD